MAGGTGCSSVDLSIRRLIVKNIEKRNLREKEPFEVLIETCKRCVKKFKILYMVVVLMVGYNEVVVLSYSK